MIEGREFDLLADIAELLKKYGPDTFEVLAGFMATPETTQTLIELLQSTAGISRTSPTANRETRNAKAVRSIRDELASIEVADSQKYTLLSDFYQALQEKSALPTLRELRSFVSDCGIPDVKVDARQKAINPLMRSLIKLPTDELAETLRAVPAYSSNDRGLLRWSEIILGKDRAVPTNE